MRRAIADAPVGDDQYGEDPSVNALQERVADLLGTEAALFLPSGTMTNQVALRTLTRPGDDVLVPVQAHIVLHETGAAAANAGVQFTEIGAAGVYDADAVRAATAVPASVLGLAPQVGDLHAGMRADVVIVDRDLHLAGVMRRGQWVTPPDQWVTPLE